MASGKKILEAIISGAVAIGIALIVEAVGFGQYVATYLTVSGAAKEVWKWTAIIVAGVVGAWSAYLAIKNKEE